MSSIAASLQARINAIKGANPSGVDIIGQIGNLINGAIASASPQEIRDVAQALLVAYFSIGAAISLGDFGSDFFDFAIGRSVAEVVRPLIDATIIEPEKVTLRRGFRYNPPSARILIAMLEAGAIDQDLLRAAMVDLGIRDEYIDPVVAYALQVANEKHQKVLVQMQEIALGPQLLPQELAIQRAESAAGKIEAEVDRLEELLVTQELANQISRLQGIASKLTTVADYADFGTESQVKTALAQLPTLTGFARGLARS